MLDQTALQELAQDLDQLLGVRGDFWGWSAQKKRTLEAPEHLEDLMRDLLVDFYGLEVRGL